MKLIVGLGNPELRYTYTRHNTGFMVVDKMLDDLGDIKLTNTKFNGIFEKTKIRNVDCIISKPLTYMNNSGEFIKPLSDFYKIGNEDIIVIYDELALNTGRIKITKTGSSAGHNGIKSIINNLGTESFVKVRVGIGPMPKNINQINFVLMKYNIEYYNENIIPIYERTINAVYDIIENGVDHAMNEYN